MVGENALNVAQRSYRMQLATPEDFIREYESNITCGGVFVPWENPPAWKSVVRLIILPPLNLEPVEIDATVVFAGAGGVGLELHGLDARKRQILDSYAERCKTKPPPVSPPTFSSPQPRSATATSIFAAPSTENRLRSPSSSPSATTPFVPPASSAPRPAAVPSSSTAETTPPSPFSNSASEFAVKPGGELIRPEWPNRPSGSGNQTGDAWTGGAGAPRAAVSEPTMEGTLDVQPYSSLLQILWIKKASGLFRLQSNSVSVRIFFRQGFVVSAAEEPVNNQHLLGELLVQSGRVKTPDRDNALKLAREQNELLGQVLINKKLLNGNELALVLLRQLELRLLAPSSLRQGYYSFIPNVGPGKGPALPRVHPLRAYLRGRMEQLRQRLPEEIKAVEDDLMDLFPIRTISAPQDMTELGLDTKELRLWEKVLTGAHSLRIVHSMTNLPRRHTHALIFTLLELNCLEFQHEMALEFRIHKLQEELDHKFSNLSKGTHFEILEVHWMATDNDVQEAHHKLLRTYDVNRTNAGIPEELRRMSTAIVKRIDEAYQAICTREQRRKYRASLVEPQQIAFSVDLLSQQGDMAFYSGNLKDALDRFVHALELQPGNVEIRQKLEEVSMRMGNYYGMPTG